MSTSTSVSTGAGKRTRAKVRTINKTTLEFMSKKDTMDFFDCGDTYLWGLVRDGKLDAYKVGKKVFFLISQINTLVYNGLV